MEGGDEPGKLASSSDVTARRKTKKIKETVWRQFSGTNNGLTKTPTMPRKIKEGDSVIVYDNSLDHQHILVRKFT